ncbi:hypothetical protein D0X58_25225, partial [Salmonella enterica]|nr:hypothetical protein [Salmonella enterica]
NDKNHYQKYNTCCFHSYFLHVNELKGLGLFAEFQGVLALKALVRGVSPCLSSLSERKYMIDIKD